MITGVIRKPGATLGSRGGYPTAFSGNMYVIMQSCRLGLSRVLVILVLLTGVSPSLAQKQCTPPTPSPTATWRFAVSGDSRNCGDVVMPAIASGARGDKALFYWHLGDFRLIHDLDQDYKRLASVAGRPLTKEAYEARAWDDFLDQQIKPFGSLPVYLGIGNHELAPPKTRSEYLTKFAAWLDKPNLQCQRAKDDPEAAGSPQTYYHWVLGGVDFINLDNASADQFDAGQMKWLEALLRRDRADTSISTVVVGMHAALPESISHGHSMNQSPQGEQSGRQAYHDLLKLQNEGHKKVYVLASHSHFFMDGVFNTEYWRNNGGVLPGWIVGTAGAVRYALPPRASDANKAATNVYGYLLGTVNPPGKPAGTISFEFHQIEEKDVPTAVVNLFTAPFVHACFSDNSQAAHP